MNSLGWNRCYIKTFWIIIFKNCGKKTHESQTMLSTFGSVNCESMTGLVLFAKHGSLV